MIPTFRYQREHQFVFSNLSQKPITGSWRIKRLKANRAKYAQIFPKNQFYEQKKRRNSASRLCQQSAGKCSNEIVGNVSLVVEVRKMAQFFMLTIFFHAP